MTQSELTDYQDSGCIDHTDEETLRRLYWDEGLSLADIAELADDVSGGAVSHHMQKHGIGRRTNSQANTKLHAGISINGQGYIRWISHDPDGTQREIGVHRLLAVAEYGIDSVKGSDIHHKNGIPWDNRPSNIDVLSPRDHAVHHNRGTSHARQKLSVRDVCEIDRYLNQGNLSEYDLAEKYDVSRGAIHDIRRGENWSHITGR